MIRPLRIFRRLQRQALRRGFRPGRNLPPIAQVEFRASESVLAAIASLGRTEDLRFSPDKRLLAVAGFGRRKILMLRVRLETTDAGPVVVSDDFMEITSDGIGRVHGIDFIDERTLVVANRDGVVTLLEVPEPAPGRRSVEVSVIGEVRGSDGARVDSPGSVAVGRTPDGLVELIVCNNYVDHVTRHVLDPGDGFAERGAAIAYRRGLEIPDGVAVSNDGGWTAISSHYTHDVKVFMSGAVTRGTPAPVGVLRKVNYPHGLRFTPDDRHLLVADAGSPFVHVYARGEGWSGSRQPERSVVVLDEATFVRGRRNPEEGGPKGLDIDRTGTIVAVTCEERALAFFALEQFTGTKAVPAAVAATR